MFRYSTLFLLAALTASSAFGQSSEFEKDPVAQQLGPERYLRADGDGPTHGENPTPIEKRFNYLSAPTVNLYPNPSTTGMNVPQLIVQGHDRKEYNYTITNTRGQLVGQGIIVCGIPNTIDQSNFSTGLYIVTVADGNEPIDHIKWMVQ